MITQCSVPASHSNPRRGSRRHTNFTRRADNHHNRVYWRPCPYVRPPQRRTSLRFRWTWGVFLLYIGWWLIKCWLPEPVTSVVPTQDSQTILVTTLDSHIRLMDNTSGKMLNEFTGHINNSYRCRACFDHAEATVICGDENGKIWAWDLLDVSNVAWLTGYDFTRPSGQSVAP